MQPVLDQLRSALESEAKPELKASAERFFKEPVRFIGLRNPDTHRIGREFYHQVKRLSKDELLALCEELMKAGTMEESLVACHWSNNVRKHFTREDFQVFERWISYYVNNWATCDTLCNHTVAEFIMKYPEFLADLKRFTGSGNRWMRRAAAVTLIIPAARGHFLKDIFEIADLLLHDKDDLVQKGYGWMLKSASESHRQEVFEFVVARKSTMPRTALRYAIEKMPAEMKKEAMSK
jgi:3-methyladenine DNA glycosylase AlkD